tara:strand:- start:581 stop:1081 length:501 start_codon:yes stop_codon:yes gene_type:complete
MDFSNLKLPIGIVVLVLGQAIASVWYVSGLDNTVKNLTQSVAEIKSTMDAKEIAILSTELSHLKEKMADVEDFDPQEILDNIHIDDFNIPSMDGLFGELDDLNRRLDNDVFKQIDDLWQAVDDNQYYMDDLRNRIDEYYYQLNDIQTQIHDIEYRLSDLANQIQWY